METQTHQTFVTNHKMFSNFKYTKEGRMLEFNVEGMKTSMLNAIRRTIINDIHNIGFGYEPKNTVTIKENTTALHDEYLAHRISLVPVMIPGWIDNPGKFDIDEYLFSLKVQQKDKLNDGGYVTTDDITISRMIDDNQTETIQPGAYFPRDSTFNTPILLTRFPFRDSVDQKLDIEFKLMKGTHSKHASFSSVVVCVCHEHDNNPNIHTFMVESVGIFTPYILLYKGIQNLLFKCKKIQDLIENDEIGTKYDAKYNAVDYIISGESHTLGNMLQEFIYDREFKDTLVGTNITHVSYHEPHPLENKIIFRLVLKDTITDFERYKTECNNLMKKYISELHDVLLSHLKNWQESSTESKTSLLKY